MEVHDPCIFCEQHPCECMPKKQKAKARPKKKKSSPPSSGSDKEASPEHKATSQPAHRVKTESKKKASAKPERDSDNLISTEARNRTEESQLFWTAMRNLVNQEMVHPISVKRSLDVYPSIPEGL